MTTPYPASQVTHFNSCVDDLISVLKLPTVWGGHQPAPIVTALVEALLVMLRQNFADSENVQSRINDLVNVLKEQEPLISLEAEFSAVNLDQKHEIAGPEQPDQVTGGRDIESLMGGIFPGDSELAARLHREALAREQELRVAAEDAEAEVVRKNGQLQEAQAHIESVLASITDTHILFDRQWRYVYVNEAAGHAIGRPRERILGRTLWELFPDIVGTELDRQYHRAMDERVPVAFDFHYPTRDTWWANRFYPTPEGLAVFATDITERKRAEEALRRGHDELEQRVFQRTEQLSAVNAELRNEIATRERAEDALRESNRRIENILESITDEFNAFDREWRFTYVNEPALNSIRRAKGEELTREEILGKNVWEMFPEHVGSVFYQKYHEALREQKTVEFEARSPVTERWIEVNAYPSEEGLSVYYRDITERKRIEQTLQEHQQRFHVALESSAVAFTFLRAVRDESAHIVDFEWLYLNPAASRILGRAPEELIARRVRQVFPDAWDPPGLFECFVQVVHTGEPRDLEVLSRRNGIDTWFRNIVAKLDDGIAVWFADATERRRAEDELRRSEAFLAEGQRISHTGSWAVKFPSEDVFWSEEMYRIYGLDPATTKLSQQLAFQLIHPEDRPSVQKAFERAVRDKSEYAVEHRAIVADGSIKHLHALGHPMFNESGDPIEYVGTVMDVTERKLAEAALRRSEAYLAEGQRLSHTASWAWNVSTGDLFWSEELFQIYGFDPEKVKPGYPMILQHIHRDDQSRVQQVFESAVREKISYELAFRIVRPDGTIRHVNNLAHPVFDASGDLIEYVGTTMDITERRQAEAAVRDAYERVDMILESISDQFFGLSKDWRFTYFNQHAARQMQLLGKDPERLIGKVLWDEFPHVPNEAALRRVMSERVAITDELFYPSLGEWVENHMYPSHDGGLVTFQRYITARKLTEEELRKTRSELAHVTRMTTMGELAASIAHEINQPLGAIVNNGNVCLRLVAAGPENQIGAREALTDIVNDAERASAIIARIRALTKRTSPEKIPLQIKDVVAGVLALAHRELAERQITARTELADDLPRVLGDRVQLQQVLLNLVVNGIEAMQAVADEERVLTIDGRREELDGRPGMLITVQDRGTGFEPEDSERLFDAFYTTKSDGLGMGLRIGRSIVEAHGGRLWAQANKDAGATFFLALPAETPGAS